MFSNIISGNYINFAICEYYNDNIFSELTQLVLTMASSSDHDELVSYNKVKTTVYTMSWQFFSSHLELMFMKTDAVLILQVL